MPPDPLIVLVIVLFNAYLLLCSLLIYRYRHDPIILVRAPRLTGILLALTFVLGNLILILRLVDPIRCIAYWIFSLIVPVYIVVQAARYIRAIFLYRFARHGLQAVAHDASSQGLSTSPTGGFTKTGVSGNGRSISRTPSMSPTIGNVSSNGTARPSLDGQGYSRPSMQSREPSIVSTLLSHDQTAVGSNDASTSRPSNSTFAFGKEGWNVDKDGLLAVPKKGMPVHVEHHQSHRDASEHPFILVVPPTPVTAPPARMPTEAILSPANQEVVELGLHGTRQRLHHAQVIRAREQAVRKVLMQLMALLVGTQFVVTLFGFMGLFSRSLSSTSSFTCPAGYWSNAYILLYVTITIYAVFGLLAILYLVLATRDAYGIRIEAVIVHVGTWGLLIFFLVTAFSASLRTSIGADLIALIMLFYVSLVMVFYPVVRIWHYRWRLRQGRMYRPTSSATGTSRRLLSRWMPGESNHVTEQPPDDYRQHTTWFQFQRLLASSPKSKAWQAFRAYSVRDFTIENTLFYERYKKCLKMISRQMRVSIAFPEAVGVVAKDPAIVQAMEDLRDMFILSGAEYEVNLSNAARRQVINGFERAASLDEPVSMEVFDHAVEETSRMMYENTFLRWLSEDQEGHAYGTGSKRLSY